MNAEVSQDRFSRDETRARNLVAGAGLLLWLLFLTPPISTWTRIYEYAQAVQYCVFAVIIPVLLVTGRPWRWVGLTSNVQVRFSGDGFLVSPTRPRLFDRIAIARAKRNDHRRAVALAILFVGQSILWRSAPMVDALVRHAWLTDLESIALVAAGTFLWVDLIESPPFRPGATRPYRIGISAVSMWTVWVLAYLMAMSGNPWYHAIHHVGGGLSQSADQQFTAGAMWFLSAAAFLPIIFSNLNRWLKSEEDPDEELYQLVRRDRTRGFFGTNP
ncbi:MAG TPA: cytochrome c oxidase assembly protein [Acidimicrobiales bacterium]|nr:cytochrome c oxidase assembly protein [Acidimicrobiales bacterium]